VGGGGIWEHMIPYRGSDKGEIYSLGIVGSSGWGGGGKCVGNWKTQGNAVVRKGNRTDHLSLGNGFGTLEGCLSPAVNYIGAIFTFFHAAATNNGRRSSLRCCHLLIARHKCAVTPTVFYINENFHWSKILRCDCEQTRYSSISCGPFPARMPHRLCRLPLMQTRTRHSFAFWTTFG
jgi:hypothetical protein